MAYYHYGPPTYHDTKANHTQTNKFDKLSEKIEKKIVSKYLLKVLTSIAPHFVTHQILWLI